MASIVSDYEYDIFISYRQKDNKGDRWVSEFVESLKTELESTFKEEVSVYFDINPHGGLLETHEVDASLKGKLKCLIFIPVISQTYCDPKSFAWQYEFCEFNKLAKEDRLGRNIRIAGGNVASRILPVKIHDLEPADNLLLENELGGVLRGIDFIYKSAGVNRPLRANEDHPQENLNKTYYRDQINKVANAVKDIINSIRYNEISTDGFTSNESLISQTRRLPFRKKLAGRNVLRASLVYILAALVFWKVLVISSGLLNIPETIIKLVTLGLVIMFPFAILLAWLYERSPKGFIRTGSVASYENPYRDEQKKPFTSNTFMALLLVTAVALFILFPQRSNTQPKNRSNDFEKSIAVLPFVNDSPDMENTYFINGIMDEILNNLQQIKDFMVLSRTSTEQFRGVSGLTIPEIGKKLDVNYIVEGSGQKYGNTFRLRVQLIDANNEKHLWGESFEQEIIETKDIFQIQSRIAQSIAAELKATITPEEKQRIENLPTTSLTAYDFYQRGHDEIAKCPYPEFNPAIINRAESYFQKALEYDSTFALAYFGLAEVLWIKIDRDPTVSERGIFNKYLDSMLVFADIALSFDDKLEGPYIVKAAYFGIKGNVKMTLAEYDKAIRYNPNDSWAYYMKGLMYEELDIVKSLENMQKAASLDHGPELNNILTRIGLNYCMAGFPEVGNEYFLEALKLDGDSIKYLNNSIRLTAGLQEDFKKVFDHFEKSYLKDSANSEVLDALGLYYSVTGRFHESLKYYKKFLSGIKEIEQVNQYISPFIGYVYAQNGYKKEAADFFKRQIEKYNFRIKSSIPSEKCIIAYQLAVIYASKGDKEKAIENLKIFNQNPSYSLKWVRAIRHPVFNIISNEPEYQKIVSNVESKYKVQHEKVGIWLEEQGKL
jgi:TolB-like protein/tetratricopeptide (TPR) repeat protein